jgi:hypothetical protein
MGFSRGPKIVTDGLVLALDAGSKKSYPDSGTTWYDLSGNGNNGTLTNGPTFGVDSGGVISFDGSNDRVECPNVNPTSLTLEFWFKWTNLNDAWLISNQTGYGNNNNGYLFRIDSPSYSCYFRAGYDTGYAQCASSITLNEWYHFTSTVNTSATKMYRNGILVSTASGVTIDYTDVTGLTIGSDRAGVVRTAGDMSNIRIYNKALTAQEVLQNYNATKSRFT